MWMKEWYVSFWLAAKEAGYPVALKTVGGTSGHLPVAHNEGELRSQFAAIEAEHKTSNQLSQVFVER